MIPTELIVLSDCVCQYTLSLRRPCIVLYWTPDESCFWYQYPINAICQILYDGTVQCRFRFTTERKYGEWLYRLFVRYTLFGKRTQTWEGKDAGPMRAGNRPTVWNDRPPPWEPRSQISPIRSHLLRQYSGANTRISTACLFIFARTLLLRLISTWLRMTFMSYRYIAKYGVFTRNHSIKRTKSIEG